MLSPTPSVRELYPQSFPKIVVSLAPVMHGSTARLKVRDATKVGSCRSSQLTLGAGISKANRHTLYLVAFHWWVLPSIVLQLFMCLRVASATTEMD